MVGRGAVYLLTDSRYVEQAQKECPQASLVERKDPIAEAAGKLVGRLKSAETVAVEKSISLAQYEALQKNVAVRLKAVDGLVEDLRSVKDEGELGAIRSAAANNASRSF